MDASISEGEAQELARALYEAERQARSLKAKIKSMRREADGYDSIAADRARLEHALSEIGTLANGASDRDASARIEAIRRIAREA